MAAGMAANDSSFTLSFSILRGLPSLLKTRGETWEVPGLDGYGAQTLGQGDGEFDFTTITYEIDTTDADNDIQTAQGAQSKLVAITDDWGNSFSNVLITHVDANQPDTKMPIIWQGNPNAVRVTIRWRACKTQ